MIQQVYESRINLNMHDLSSLTPRVTQYHGVQFRSKSEAVFARCLDLAGIEWTYEPFEGKDDPPGMHQWDFLLFLKAECLATAIVGNHSFLADHHWIESRAWFVEYKPSRPTDAYVQELFDRVMNARDERMHPGNFAIIYGSPWQSGFYEQIVLLLNKEEPLSKFKPSRLEFISEFVSEALRYRFDICSQQSEPSIEYRLLNFE